MTLRLPPDDADALKRFAELTERSMQEVVREYIHGHSHRMLVDKVLDEDLPNFAEALERLGQ